MKFGPDTSNTLSTHVLFEPSGENKGKNVSEPVQNKLQRAKTNYRMNCGNLYRRKDQAPHTAMTTLLPAGGENSPRHGPYEVTQCYVIINMTY